MYKPKLIFALLLLCSGIYIACNKDNLNSSGPQATVTFAGRILDENGQAILGAQVRVEGESAFTDKNGVFRLKPVRVDADNAIGSSIKSAISISVERISCKTTPS